jgi:hypothetical protein
MVGNEEMMPDNCPATIEFDNRTLYCFLPAGHPDLHRTTYITISKAGLTAHQYDTQVWTEWRDYGAKK